MRPKPQSSSTGKRLLKIVAGISAMLLTAASSVFAANTTVLPDFSQVLLTPASQASQAWTNTIPNALADYYTYIPYSNADAVALGFPAVCGNPKLASLVPARVPTAADLASTADCYTISVRQFGQPMSLDFLKNVGIPGFPGNGLLQADGVTPFFNGTTLAGTLTTAWGYGSGGVGWTPPYQTAPAKVVTGNAPGPFQAVTFGAIFGPGASGQTGDTGVWHFPAPTIKGTKNREVYVQWINDLPNVRPVGHDPSVDCGINAPNCFPYNRIITHVHGAHVTPESDGLATAWFTPNFLLQGENAFPPTAFFDVHPGSAIAVPFGPKGTYRYPLTQEAGTIWYHDHAVGTTHLNTDMGMAGFFPVTDLNEQSLLTLAQPATALPAPVAKALPASIYDFGFALQDRNFDISGQMVMPDYAIYNKADPACTLTVDGLADPETCPRLQWMKDVDDHLIPYVATSPLLLNANNIGFSNEKGPFELPGQGAPFPATSATLEYFGNMPVVNGVTYGQISMEKRVNRIRFIGGTDSRTWILKMFPVVGGVVVSTPGSEIPFYQMASEQGLLNKPVLRTYLDIMGGERIDVLVDFKAANLPVGTTGIRVVNVGGDTPYSGNQDYLAGAITPSTDIPEVMQINLVAASTNIDSIAPATLAASATTPLRPGILQADGSGMPIVPYAAPAVIRNVSLIEITDQYGRTMPTIDGRGFIPPGVPTTEIIFPNRVEQWDIINTTVDAHPMHIHQIAFQTINRQAIDFFVAPGANIATQTFTPPSYTTSGAVLPAAAWEVGEKDTIQCPPGYVTRVQTIFDLLGDYVWHCHILSHEEHDMMRPFTVTTTAVAPRFINVPATNDTGRYTISWGGTSIPGAQYVLQRAVPAVAPALPVFTTVYIGSATSVSVFNAANGSYLYQVGVVGTAGTVSAPFAASPFTAVSDGAVGTSPTATIVVNVPVTGMTPVPLTTLPSTATVTFSWPNSGAALYQLWVGTTGVGSRNVWPPITAPASAATTATVSVPATGLPVYVRLWSKTGTRWSSVDYTYTAAAALSITTLSPLPSFTVGGAAVNVTFAKVGGVGAGTWSAPAGLPAGLLLNAATGVLSGSPTGATGTYNFNIAVTDASTVPVTVTKAFALTVNPAVGAPVITNASPLAPYTLGTGIYTVSFTATGGVAPYTWTASAGLPAGITMSTAGVLSGTPSVPGTYNFNVTVTDTTLPTAISTVKAFTLVVVPNPLAITTVSPLAPYTVNTLGGYSVTLAAAGGIAPYTWAVAPASTLPAGLTLTAAGVLSGAPTAPNTYIFSVQVTDSQVPAVTTIKQFTLVVSSGLNVALAANGGVATASSQFSAAFPVTSLNNGDRLGLNWLNGGGWNDATPYVFGDWVEIAFNAAKTITEVDVFTIQDTPATPVTPTLTTTFALYGATAFNVEYWNSGTLAWTAVPGGVVVGNNLVWKQLIFAAITTTKIRVVVNASADGLYSRLAEIEAR
jgi:FtsP/CotA-like multicopper oxidase with cupredoxin domain